jgi:uncharacterized phage protein (TIGR01671 family)
MMENSRFKFRAWDKQYNFMIPSEDIHPRVMNELITGEGKVLEIDERHSYLGTDISYTDISDDRILMQYTGLKDKNGKGIYEGDIIQEKYGNEFGVGKVVFEDGAFWVHFSDDEYLLIGCDSEETEVLGNIYENPELLEVSS